MEFYDFPWKVGNFIIPTDDLIFFRGVRIPPTSSKSTNRGIEWDKASNDGLDKRGLENPSFRSMTKSYVYLDGQGFPS